MRQVLVGCGVWGEGGGRGRGRDLADYLLERSSVNTTDVH